MSYPFVNKRLWPRRHTLIQDGCKTRFALEDVVDSEFNFFTVLRGLLERPRLIVSWDRVEIAVVISLAG
jgi:hypothetical protein